MQGFAACDMRDCSVLVSECDLLLGPGLTDIKGHQERHRDRELEVKQVREPMTAPHSEGAFCALRFGPKEIQKDRVREGGDSETPLKILSKLRPHNRSPKPRP